MALSSDFPLFKWSAPLHSQPSLGKTVGWPDEESLKARTKELRTLYIYTHSLAEGTSEYDRVILEVSEEPAGPEI